MSSEPRRRYGHTTVPAGAAADPVGRETCRRISAPRHFGVNRYVRAVDGITFDVRRGEIYGLAGESSSGKTTLVKTIAGAIKPPLEVVGGTVEFAFLPGYGGLHRGAAGRGGADSLAASVLHHAGLDERAQSGAPVAAKFCRFRAAAHRRHRAKEFEAAVVGHLARVKLDASVLAAYPHELSGGMRQRATIALATICRPDFIIADEPTTALDVVVQKDVLGMIRGIQREIGSSVLFVTHDMGVHAHLTDRLGIMYAGRLVEEAATPEIFRNPLHPYTKHLISSLPRIGNDVPRKGLEGAPPNLADPPPGCRFHPRCPLAMEVCSRRVPDMIETAPGHRVACFAVNGSGEP